MSSFFLFRLLFRKGQKLFGREVTRVAHVLLFHTGPNASCEWLASRGCWELFDGPSSALSWLIYLKRRGVYIQREREREICIYTPRPSTTFVGITWPFRSFPPLSYVIVWALFYWASTARQKSERKSQLPVKEEEEKKFHDTTACVLFIKLFAHKGNIRQNAKCGVIKQTKTMKSITTLRVRLIRQFVSLSLARAIGFEFNWFLRLSSSIRTRRCQKVYSSLRIPRVAISRLALWTSTG